MTEQRLGARAYCIRCRKDTGWIWDGGQNTLTPQADYWRCLVCGHRRLQLANVTDAFALAKYVLDRERKMCHYRTLDYDDALGHLHLAVWEIYLNWHPEQTASFLAYASYRLGQEFWTWVRRTYGRDAPQYRHYLKTAAYEVSLEALADGYTQSSESGLVYESGDVGAVLAARSGLGGASRSSEGDPGESGDASLRRAIEQGNRIEARGDGILGQTQARRVASGDH